MTTFRRCVAKHGGERKVKISCLDQYLCMAFAQLRFRESLRDIEACLRAQIASSITWAFEVVSPAARWQIPRKSATAGYTKNSLSD